MIIARKMWTDMGGGCHGIPDPPNWLYNQENMRMMYDVICMGHAQGLHRSDISPELVGYFKYMYDAFPPGYNKIVLAEFYKNA